MMWQHNNDINWAVNRVWQHNNIKLTDSDTLAKATEFAFLGPSRKLRRTRTILLTSSGIDPQPIGIN